MSVAASPPDVRWRICPTGLNTYEFFRAMPRAGAEPMVLLMGRKVIDLPHIRRQSREDATRRPSRSLPGPQRNARTRSDNEKIRPRELNSSSSARISDLRHALSPHGRKLESHLLVHLLLLFALERL